MRRIRTAGHQNLDGRGHEVSTRALAALAVVAILAQPAPPMQPPLATPLATMLDRAAAYVDRFEHDFAQVISDEDYRQHVGGAMYRRAESRRTQAEMLFLWMAPQHDWLTVRNVRVLDGKPIPNSENKLTAALAPTTEAPLTQLRRLRDESARFNIGHTFRNVNYPTMALHVLEDKYRLRFGFAIEGREKIDGVDTWRVAYHEEQAPTLIQNEHGRNLFSRGRLWIADADGRIVRTTLDVEIPDTDTTMSTTVDYRRDAKLAMWVPGRMRELIEQRAQDPGRGRAVVSERIDCTAEYTNYRRFETSGRIIQ